MSHSKSTLLEQSPVKMCICAGSTTWFKTCSHIVQSYTEHCDSDDCKKCLKFASYILDLKCDCCSNLAKKMELTYLQEYIDTIGGPLDEKLLSLIGVCAGANKKGTEVFDTSGSGTIKRKIDENSSKYFTEVLKQETDASQASSIQERLTELGGRVALLNEFWFHGILQLDPDIESATRPGGDAKALIKWLAQKALYYDLEWTCEERNQEGYRACCHET